MVRAAVDLLTRADAPRTALHEALRARTGARHVALTDSGTSALRLAIEYATLRPGARRRVALPAWSCYDLVSAAVGADVEIDFYDLDPMTLAPDTPSLRAALAREPAAVVIVHAFGVPMDVEPFRTGFAPGTLLIEDCAQAWGARLSQRPLGERGDFAVFSFSRGKGITGGSGGALASRGTENPAVLPAPGAGVRDLVGCLALLALSPPAVFAIPSRIPALRLGETRYRPPHAVGALSRAAAAVLHRGLADSDAGAEARRVVADALRLMLASHDRFSPIVAASNAEPSWLRFPVLAESLELRDLVVREGRALGVAASYPQPLPNLVRQLRGSTASSGEWPGAERLASSLFTLPTHSAVSHQMIGQLDALLTQCANAAPAGARRPTPTHRTPGR